MAAPNEILAPRLNLLLHKLLAMQEGAPAPILATEVFPGLTIESDRPEWKYLSATRMGIGTSFVAHVGGVLSQIALQNPVNSGAIVVVELIHGIVDATILAAGNLVWALYTGTVTLTPQNTAIQRDLRNQTVGNPGSNLGLTAQILAGTNVAAAPGATGSSIIHVMQMPAASPGQTYPVEVVLKPGTGIIAYGATGDQGWRAGFRWYERAFEESER